MKLCVGDSRGALQRVTNLLPIRVACVSRLATVPRVRIKLFKSLRKRALTPMDQEAKCTASN